MCDLHRNLGLYWPSDCLFCFQKPLRLLSSGRTALGQAWLADQRLGRAGCEAAGFAGATVKLYFGARVDPAAQTKSRPAQAPEPAACNLNRILGCKRSGFPNLVWLRGNAGHGVAGVHDAGRPLGQFLIIDARRDWSR